MKNILIIIFSLTTFSLNAQPPAPGTYTPVPELDKFVGTWKAVSTKGDTMMIILQKQKVHMPYLEYDKDMIIGWHNLKSKFGGVKQSNLQYVGTQLIYKNTDKYISLLGTSEKPTMIYFIGITDITKQKTGDGYFTLLPGSLTQATWKLYNSRGIKIGHYDWSFELPETLTFTKQ